MLLDFFRIDDDNVAGHGKEELVGERSTAARRVMRTQANGVNVSLVLLIKHASTTMKMALS